MGAVKSEGVISGVSEKVVAVESEWVVGVREEESAIKIQEVDTVESKNSKECEEVKSGTE